MTKNNYENLITLKPGKGDVFILVERMHTWMTESQDEEDYFRPYLMLVIDLTSLMILGLEIKDTPPGVYDVLDLLADTYVDTGYTKAGKHAVRYKPGNVIVESAAMADSLKEHLIPLGIGVVHSKRPRQITGVLRDFMANTSDRFEDDYDGLIKSTALSVKQAKGFYGAANAFFSRTPWSLIADSSMLRIAVPSLKKTFYVSVMGQGEVQYGLSLYTKPEQVQYFLGNSDVENWKYPRSGLHMLLFSAPPDYSVYDLDYVCDHQISIPSMVHMPCPLLFHTKTITYPDQDMILWYEGVLNALPDFIEAHFPLEGPEETDSIEEKITVQTSQGALEVQISFPGVDMAQMYPEIDPATTGSAGSFISPVEQWPVFEAIFSRQQPPDDRRKAQDLIYDAWDEAEPARQIALARQALELWPDCADAFNTLAAATGRTAQKMALYDQAVQAGQRALGEEFLADQHNVGHFWGILETRPYMRALAGVGQMSIKLRLFTRAEEIIRNMLYLNPGDNQGVRYLLLEILLEGKRYVEALEFIDRWDDISPDFNYTRALLRFEKKGDYRYARTALQKAFEYNPHVPAYLCLRKRMHANESGTISMGRADEAEDYVQRHFRFWRRIPGALAWLELTAIGDAIIKPMQMPC